MARLMDADLERQLDGLHPSSFGWALSCCGGDAAEAEEVLQVVYLKILEGRARFGGRSTLKTWLFAVIRRTAFGRRRRRRLRAALLLRWGGAEPGAVGRRQEGSGETDLSRRESERSVRRALAEISPRQRQVLELVFFHELTVREAAEAMGVSAGTASLHYDRGKRRLRHLLGSPETV